MYPLAGCFKPRSEWPRRHPPPAGAGTFFRRIERGESTVEAPATALVAAVAVLASPRPYNPPRLVQGDVPPDELHDCLLAIGGAFRHSAYRRNDTRFFASSVDRAVVGRETRA